MKIFRFTKIHPLESSNFELLLFCFPLAFIFLIECIMSYYFPIMVESTLNSNLLVGLIIGAANIVAIFCDLVFPQIFSKKGWKFFFLAAVAMQIGFPYFANLAYIFNSIYLFILAAVFWNIYFEFFSFARHNFISTVENRANFSRTWGITSVIVSVTSIVGPIIGSYLLVSGIATTSVVISFLHIVVICFTLLLIFKTPNAKPENKIKIRSKLKSELHIFREFQYWKIIGLRIFPVLILGLMIMVINSAVFTVGGLMGEEVLGGKHLDWLLIVAFDTPAFIAGIALARLNIAHRKKRYSQLLFIIGSIPLVALVFFRGNPLITLSLFFLCSIFVSSAWVLNEAVYSDLQQRASQDKVHISSMERIGESMGYFIGPILIGFLSDRTDYFAAFSILGIVGIIVGLVLFLITPRKLRLPQTQLGVLAK